MTDLRRYFETLYDACAGWIELRSFPSKARCWAEVGDWAPLESFVAQQTASGETVYNGVCTRRDTSNGRADNLRQSPGVWLDHDVASVAQLPAVITRVDGLPFRPTLRVGSGLGLHDYLLFREPLDLTDSASLQSFCALLRRLQQYLGADPRATDPARTLRPPSTVNRKYDTPKPVTLEICRNGEARFNPSELDAFLPAEVIVNNRMTLENTVKKGQRDDTMLRIVRTLRNQGLPIAAIMTQAELLNETFEPPLTDKDDDFHGKLRRWIFQYRDRSDFDGRPVDVVFDVPVKTPPAPASDASSATAQTPLSERATGWPAPMSDAVRLGVFGDILDAIAKHTEADPAALLLSALASFGVALGRTAHWEVEADRHYLILFVLLVGISSKGRKGVSEGHIRRLFEAVDPTWSDRVREGLSSGEGLIFHVRDRVETTKPLKQHGEVVGYETVVLDAGVSDKRALVTETEFASVLRVLAREGNTLSPVLRRAWQGQSPLETLTKNEPVRATGAHLGVLGHITLHELRGELRATELGNGFANRFLFVCVERVRELPNGGAPVDIAPVVTTLRSVLDFSRTVGLMRRDEEAEQRWARLYSELSTAAPGLLGSVTSRAEAQVMRLAALFALGDRSAVVRLAHLEAGLEVWRYCFQSAKYIFRTSTGDTVADIILAALLSSDDGLTRTDIRDLFHRHKSRVEIDNALLLLAELKLVASTVEGTDGRSIERWRVQRGRCAT